MGEQNRKREKERKGERRRAKEEDREGGGTRELMGTGTEISYQVGRSHGKYNVTPGRSKLRSMHNALCCRLNHVTHTYTHTHTHTHTYTLTLILSNTHTHLQTHTHTHTRPRSQGTTHPNP